MTLAGPFAFPLTFARPLASVLAVGQVQVGELVLGDRLKEVANPEGHTQHARFRIAVVDVLVDGLRTDDVECRARLPRNAFAVDDAVADTVQHVQVGFHVRVRATKFVRRIGQNTADLRFERFEAVAAFADAHELHQLGFVRGADRFHAVERAPDQRLAVLDDRVPAPRSLASRATYAFFP